MYHNGNYVYDDEGIQLPAWRNQFDDYGLAVSQWAAIWMGGNSDLPVEQRGVWTRMSGGDVLAVREKVWPFDYPS